ncbi:hypothetical protein [Petrachloros mirabilis]
MKLNEALNLVLPVGDKSAYHTPISREVFEANYRILAATKAAISSHGVYYQMDSGPRIAALALKDEAKKDAEDRGDEVDASIALLAEIKRLTVILCPSVKGWDMLPVDAAIAGGHIDADDWREAESSLVFFTCLWSLASKANREKVAQATSSLLMASITSLSALEYSNSLLTSTQDQDSKTVASVVPS